MATLYDIDTRIMNCIDEETGEILDEEKLSELMIERDEKIEGVALWYKNTLSDVADYKAEKESFAEKQKEAQKRADGLKKWLDNALSGEEYKSARVLIKWRASSQVQVDDESQFVKWAQDERDDLLDYPEPKISKARIKDALKAGEKIPFAEIVTNKNIQIK